MSEKNFTVAGVSTQNGVTKVRLANSMNRVKVLAKNGHTDIQLFEMPFPGAKEDAIDFLLGKDLGEAGNAVVKEMAIELGFVFKDKPKAEPVVEAAKVDIAELEEAPF